MGTPVEPKPTKYFIAFLVADLSLAGGEAELSFKLGGIDARATTMAWQESKFYRGEMGAHLWRGFWSLQSLRSAVDLVAVSSTSKRSKIKFRDPLSGGRRVNLDPAYLDALKVVLASTQNAQPADLSSIGD